MVKVPCPLSLNLLLLQQKKNVSSQVRIELTVSRLEVERGIHFATGTLLVSNQNSQKEQYNGTVEISTDELISSVRTHAGKTEAVRRGR